MNINSQLFLGTYRTAAAVFKYTTLVACGSSFVLVTPLTLINQRTSIVAISGSWLLLAAAAVAWCAVFVATSDTHELLKAWALKWRVLFFVVSSVFLWASFEAALDIYVSKTYDLPTVVPATVVSDNKLRKIVACTEEVALVLESGKSARICAGHIKHSPLASGDQVVLHGRRGWLGIAVDDIAAKDAD